jgi:Loader and inhibitor of phage G40P
MNTNEATAVLAALASAWPNQDLTEPTVEVWRSFLDEIDADDGLAAAREVIGSERYFPPIARFREAANAARQARLNREAATRGLPRHEDQPVGPERWRAAVELARNTLAERNTRKHWHGGPDPCPVCGGGPPPPGGRCRSGEIIDLQQRLAERRRRLEAAP